MIMRTRQLVLPAAFIILSFLAACGGGDNSGGDKDSTAAASAAEKKMEALQQVPAGVRKTVESSLLRFQFTEGDIFTYRIHSVTHVEEQTDTVRQVSMQDVAYTYRFEVLETDGSGASRLRTTCREVVFHGKYGDRELTYDSKSPVDKNQERMFMQYTAALNTPFEIFVAADGSILRVASIDKVVERLMGTDYRSASADAKRQVAEDYGNNALKDVIQLAFQKLSDKPVATDSSWFITWSGNLGFLKVKNVGTYTLQGSEKSDSENLAHIGIKMRTRYVGPPKVETGQGTATIAEFDVRGTGRTLFDLGRKRTKSRKMEQELKTRITVDPPKELKEQMPNMGLIRIVQHATISTTVEAL